MEQPFTPEQKARIREILREVLSEIGFDLRGAALPENWSAIVRGEIARFEQLES